MRATQKKMMSCPVTSVAEGRKSAKSSVSLGQPKVAKGHNADENQVSSTSSSRERGRVLCEIIFYARRILIFRDVDITLRIIKSGNLMAPPLLAADAPILNVSHPGKNRHSRIAWAQN